jgi:hypothetical protein
LRICSTWTYHGIVTVGDIHQPLHTANDADRGGNCVLVDSQPPARNLHDAWDTTIVRRLEESGGTPEATAHTLEHAYAAEKALDAWTRGHTDDIARESNQSARSDIYAALHIPVEPCAPLPPCAAMNPRSILTRHTWTMLTWSRATNSRKQDSGWRAF